MAATAPHEVTVYYNPGCKHCRGTVDLLNEQSVDYGIVEYLVAPPNRETLESIAEMLVDPVGDLIRTTDKKFVALGLDSTAYTSADAVINFLLVHPELMQRPVVVRAGKAIIGRPPERIAAVFG